MGAKNLAQSFRVTDGSKFRLKDFDPGSTAGLSAKEHSADALEAGLARLSELQAKTEFPAVFSAQHPRGCLHRAASI